MCYGSRHAKFNWNASTIQIYYVHIDTKIWCPVVSVSRSLCSNDMFKIQFTLQNNLIFIWEFISLIFFSFFFDSVTVLFRRLYGFLHSVYFHSLLFCSLPSPRMWSSCAVVTFFSFFIFVSISPVSGSWRAIISECWTGKHFKFMHIIIVVVLCYDFRGAITSI